MAELSFAARPDETPRSPRIDELSMRACHGKLRNLAGLATLPRKGCGMDIIVTASFAAKHQIPCFSAVAIIVFTME